MHVMNYTLIIGNLETQTNIQIDKKLIKKFLKNIKIILKTWYQTQNKSYFQRDKKSHGNKICVIFQRNKIQENLVETKFRKKVKIHLKICLNKVEKISKFYQKSV